MYWLLDFVFWSKERNASIFRRVPESEFGWEETLYNDWWEKFDFMLLQVKLTGKYDDDYAKHHETLLAWFQQFDPEIRHIIIPEEYTDEDKIWDNEYLERLLDLIELPNNTNDKKFIYGKNKFRNCGKLKLNK